jgi:hypothetical protein
LGCGVWGLGMCVKLNRMIKRRKLKTMKLKRRNIDIRLSSRG